MAKLIRILAASLGGGLVLGAGIRLGERLVSQGAGEGSEAAGILADRLGRLEGRLSHIEGAQAEQPVSETALRGIESRIDEQAAAASAVRVRLDTGVRRMETPIQTEERLPSEMRAWMEQRLDERLRGVESTLRRESDEARRETLSAVVESVQTRVILRISKLEEEVAGQAAGMQELRECTLRTEQSMHKLLGGIDRLIAAQAARDAAPLVPAGQVAAPVPAEAGNGEAAGSPPAPLTRPRRWSIFG